MSYERGIEKRLERCRQAKIAAIERDNREPPAVIRYKKHGLPHAIHELKHPSDPRLTPLTDAQIYQDLEDFCLKH